MFASAYRQVVGRPEPTETQRHELRGGLTMAQTNEPAAFTGFEPGAELSSQQIEVKAHELLAQLTLDEKICEQKISQVC